MEEEPQRPYSVLTKDEVKEMMKKQTDDISEIFLVSRSEATVLLMNSRWDSIRVSERLSQTKESFMTESGLRSVISGLRSIAFGPKRVLSDSPSDEFSDENIVDDGDYLVSTPLCSHEFHVTYWREYLEEKLISFDTPISCPHQDCHVSVGPDTIEKLRGEERELYEKYVFRSYLEGAKKEMIKLCPATNCEYVVEFHRAADLEEHSANVVCLCGHVFCWRCDCESHVPVTCNNATDWLNSDLPKLLAYESSSLRWIEANTKPCPHCYCPVDFEKTKFPRFITCACSGRFCRECLWPETAHTTSSSYWPLCPQPKIQFEGKEKVDTSCVDRWEACQLATVEAKSNLRAFDESVARNPTVLMDQDVKNMREGLMLIVQCRQVLKWVAVYDYLQSEYEMAKKEYLLYLQDTAAEVVYRYAETLKEAVDKAFSADSVKDVTSFRHKLFAAKSEIGNYFYHFLKTLNDGLVDVKVRSYDNFAGPTWFCDRCTFGSSWFVMNCKMCCDPVALVKREMSYDPEPVKIDMFDDPAPEKIDMFDDPAPEKMEE